MSRIRTIKPEFWVDSKIVQLPFEARLLFLGMLNFSDDDGYLADEPDQLRLQILPNDQLDCGLLVDLLVVSGLLNRIELVSGKTILQMVNFSKHQKISHKVVTKFAVSGAKKKNIPANVRRQIAVKYGCKPGHQAEATCYYCGSAGSMKWWTLSNGKPSGWVSFSGLEIEHFTPENSGGLTEENNIVLSCRYCNRSKGITDGQTFFMEKYKFLWNVPECSPTKGMEGKGMELKG